VFCALEGSHRVLPENELRFNASQPMPSDSTQ
jgi:hypothetical protein